TTDGINNSGVTVQAGATTAANAGVDGLSYEAVGTFNTSDLIATAFPTAPVLIDDANDLPDPTQQGFVFEVDSFADYEAAIASKIQTIVDNTGGGGDDPGDPEVIPLPAGLPLLLAGLGAFAVVRVRNGRTS
ncbi:MAG: VPLPA-CTERM sorting domain-containing protein, partial [Pseudomonadota bacterium]